MSNNQLPADNWVRDNRQWNEYPEGTKAKALMGGYRIKTERGWHWPGGGTFPTPGGDATGEVCLPFIDVFNKIKMSNKLPADVRERIRKEASEKYRLLNGADIDTANKRMGYIVGATAEAERAQKQIRNLLYALNQIIYSPVPANEREYMSWFVTAKNVAGGAISEYEAEIEMQQWKEGKEVGNDA